MVASKRVQRWFVTLLIWGLLLFGVRIWLQWGMVSGVAPVVEGPTLNTVEGEPVLIHFWATWCVVCAAENESLTSLAEDYPILTVATRSGGPQEVKRYVEEQGLRAPVMFDPEGYWAKQFGVSAVPATFILNPKREIVFVERGFTTEWGLRLRVWLAGLLD